MGFLDKFQDKLHIHHKPPQSQSRPLQSGNAATGPYPPSYSPPPGASLFPSSTQPPLSAAGPRPSSPLAITGPSSPLAITGPSPTLPITGPSINTLLLYDTTILADDSASMQGENWREASIGIAAIAPYAVQYDDDGIDVYFFNSQKVGKNLKNADDVNALFHSVRPNGGTPTGSALQRVIEPHLKECEQSARVGRPFCKPLNIIVITDGAATDDPEKVIVNAAKRLDKINAPKNQVGIQFFVVGNDRRAQEFVRGLDEDLHKKYPGLRDIVDASSLKEGGSFNEKVLKILLGGVETSFDAAGSVGATASPWSSGQPSAMSSQKLW